MVKIPPYLEPGDTIAVLCPAGYMSESKAAACLETFTQWGYRVKIGKTLGGDSQYYFSAPDQDRLDDFQQMLDDDSIKAIFCARGGYGITRIIDRIKFKQFKKKPKWIIGFSDVTILHAHIYRNYGVATLHAPMASAFNDGGMHSEYVLSLRHALEGQKIRYQAEPHPFNRRGKAVGELVGGNLCLLSHLVGTDSDLPTKGRILFLEDVGEYLYNIDRLLYQLKRAGKLEKLAGLVVGGFTECKDTDRPFGKEAYEIIRDIFKEYAYPICFGFPVSHGAANLALKTGLGYKLIVSKTKVSLTE